MYDYEEEKWPITYSKHYNVHFYGIEKLHPFDATKWENVYNYLKKWMPLDYSQIYQPEEATTEELLLVHTQSYLKSLTYGRNVAKIAEIPILAILPNCCIQRCYLRPMRYQTKGTMLAGDLAVKRGWAINIGGGFHHCSRNAGGGFCPYADITLMIEHLFLKWPKEIQKVMILDLDAHQGNGYERDFLKNPKVFIMDVYNQNIYPRDSMAKQAIDCKVELESYTSDEEYLEAVSTNLRTSLQNFLPNLIVYNAGTDILVDDPLGRLSITTDGIIQRDELVFNIAIKNNIPIVMLTSGGYTTQSAPAIARSILNLHQTELI